MSWGLTSRFFSPVKWKATLSSLYDSSLWSLITTFMRSTRTLPGISISQNTLSPRAELDSLFSENLAGLSVRLPSASMKRSSRPSSKARW